MNNSNNSSNINLKNTEWIISRMLEILNVYQNALNSNKEIFEKSSKDFLSKLEKNKNNSLSITISIIGLIFSIDSFGLIKNRMNEEFYNWIILVILTGIISYGLYNYLKMSYKIRNVSEELLKVSKEYYDGYTIQNFLKGFFNRITEEIDKLEKVQPQKFQTLDTFFLLVQGSIVSSIYKSNDNLIENLKNKKKIERKISKWKLKIPLKWRILNVKEINELEKLIKPTDDSGNLFKQIMDYAYNDSINKQILSKEKINTNDLIQMFPQREKLLIFLKDKIENNISDIKKMATESKDTGL